VIHSHGAVIRHPYNLLQFRDLLPGDVLYTPMPLFWVGGLTWTLLSGMHAGAKIVFERQFEAGNTLETLERERVTHVIGWPHMAKALVEHPTFEERDLSSIRGGSLDELLPEELRVGDPELRASSLGMTESLGPHSLERIGSALPPDKRGSFGRAVPGVERRIVDPVTGEDLAVGEMGEICIRGYSLMLGILERTEAEVFEPGGWYRTGDGGYLDDDGHLYFKGRLGDVIKSSGTNVTPREIEIVIEEQPGVMHAFVVGVPHHERGEDIAAAVVARPGRSIDAVELRTRIKAELASYKVPRHMVVFDHPDDLPWLDNGKIDLRAVRGLLVDRFATEG
jgi:acyl-CoA synthetase (AMP-forming)/AMP-acid ligase II